VAGASLPAGRAQPRPGLTGHCGVPEPETAPCQWLLVRVEAGSALLTLDCQQVHHGRHAHIVGGARADAGPSHILAVPLDRASTKLGVAEFGVSNAADGNSGRSASSQNEKAVSGAMAFDCLSHTTCNRHTTVHTAYNVQRAALIGNFSRHLTASSHPE
jgi:hypothetical protein